MCCWSVPRGPCSGRPRPQLHEHCRRRGHRRAHTLDQHVVKSDAQMMEKAQKAQGGVATRWTDEATAVRAVDEAFQQWIQQPGNAKSLDDWKQKETQKQAKPQYVFFAKTDALPLEWTLRGEGSLRTAFKVGGPAAGEAASNKVRILLKYVGKSHKPSKFVVFTAHPL
ncbi:RNase A-like domain-containing protein [Streptomyces sp. NPDC052236]|uniref:RNase A-like domain-containing protein n=1 Tax=Streptomyces sp. NPDC052236 TaxID=3365686 RepID=UPI0037D32C46